jgi:hypothetical protein
MAPNRPPGPLDPNRIDVSLSLMGQEDTRVLDDLAMQLSTLNEHVQNISNSLQPEAMAQGQQRLASRMHGNILHGESPTSSRPPSRPPQDGAGMAASFSGEPPHPSGWRRARSYARSGFQSALTREMEIYSEREETQARRRGAAGHYQDFENYSIHTPSPYDLDTAGMTGRGAADGTGGVSSGASAPGGGGPDNRPLWLRALQSNPAAWERSQEGIVLPQFGELTIQDKLNFASNFFARSATNTYQNANADARQASAARREAASLGYSEAEINEIIARSGINAAGVPSAGQFQGNTAAVLRMAAEQSGNVITAGREINRFFRWNGGLRNAGVQAGFDPMGGLTIPGTQIGILNPLDALRPGSAVREGLNQRMNVARLRLRPGISGAQANDIVGSLAGLGWTGEEGQNAAFDAIAPLVQQGLNPEITANLFDQAVRTGNTSLAEFRSTMEHLGPSAREARMSLDEYQQSLGNFAEWAQQNGATFGQGLQSGRTLSTAFGMAPQMVQQGLSSTFTQSTLLARYGVLPNELGLVASTNPSVAAEGIFGGIDMALRATRPFAHDRRDAQGHLIERGRDRQVAQAAQMLGMSPDLLKNYMRVRPYYAHAGAAGTAVSAYERQVRGMTQNESRALQDEAHHPGIFHKIKANDQRQLDQDWGGVEKELRALAPTDQSGHNKWMDQINELRSDDRGERAEKARKLIADRMKSLNESQATNTKVQVEFTGAAAKWLQQHQSELPKDLRGLMVVALRFATRLRRASCRCGILVVDNV